MLPWAEMVNLVLNWLDTGVISPKLVGLAAEKIAEVPVESLVASAEADANLAEKVASIPGAVAAARAWLGAVRLARMRSMAPSDALKAVDAVIDALLERSPEHGLALYAHRDWACRTVTDVVNLIAGSEQRKVVTFAKKRGP